VVRRWLEQHTRLDDLTIEPLPAQQLRDTYLDTEDWRVLRAGFALRLREKAGHSEATLKALRSARDDVADRREITESLCGDGDKPGSGRRGRNDGTGRNSGNPAISGKALAHATGPVATRVRHVAGKKPLRILFEVRTTRQRFSVRRANDSVDIGEIALDEARFSRADGHRRPMVLTRVELEAVGSDSTPVARLAQRLRSECGLNRATENKFTVGLRSAALEPPRDARPDRAAAEPPPVTMDSATRAGDFAAETLHRLFREWQAKEPAARLGEGPEGLHELRVAARRIDTVLRLFRSCVPAASAKSRPTLKRLLDLLGDVRNGDIRLQAVSAFRDGLPESDRAALDPLMRHLESERAAARAAMLRGLDAKPARQWLETLPEQILRAVNSPAAASSRQAAALTVMPDLIRERYRKLRKCARRLTSDSSMREFHKVRIRAKKLRYALEVAAPTYAKPAKRMIAALQKLQSRLGAQHDAHVLAGYLAQLALHPPKEFTAATLFMMGRLAQLNAAEAARLGRKVEKPWRKVRGRRWKSLRSRMQELRDDTRKHNKKIGTGHRSTGGDGKPTGAGSSGRTTGNGKNAFFTSTNGRNGHANIASAAEMWPAPHASRH